MNFLRAGKLANNRRTVIVVPAPAPASPAETVSPSDTSTRAPCGLSGVLETSVTWETAAMLGSASPRNPRVDIASRSGTSVSLLVANRSKASAASSEAIPDPLSATLISSSPPATMAILISVLPASSEFSTSSLTTEAGRSMTSPAAILDETSWGSSRMGTASLR